MKKFVIIILFLVSYQIGFSQKRDTINQFDKNGLKIGYWKLDNVYGAEELSFEGKFIVIPINKSIDYSKDIEGLYFRHNNLNYSGKTDEFISVFDGEWISYRKKPGKNSKIARIDYYKNGVTNKYRRFPPLNNHELLSDYTEISVRTDSSYRYDTYLGNDTIVFESHERTEFNYYPNKKLKLLHNMLRLNSLYSMPDTIYLKFKARETIIIDSISTLNKNLEFMHHSIINPNSFSLNTNQTDSIGIIYKPDRNKIEDRATFIIHGDDCNYKVYLRLRAYDINWRNLRTVDSLTFFKKDKIKLNIQGIGLYSIFKIYNWKDKDNLENKKPIISGYSSDTGSSGPLNLSKLKRGEYVLQIRIDDRIEEKVKLSIK
jgi:hypothetical protein